MNTFREGVLAGMVLQVIISSLLELIARAFSRSDKRDETDTGSDNE